jgi:type IV pilus assembly protein PilX
MNLPRLGGGQRGVALITVMVILLLSIIAVLAAGRTGLLNEALVGNDSDYGRTLAAAEALLRDAEMDVRGRANNGFLCHPDPAIGAGSSTPEAGWEGCRNTNIAGNAWFPAKIDFAEVRALVATVPATPCLQGVCIPADMTTLASFEDNPATMAAMAPLGVRYGTYTGVAGALGGASVRDTNPILKPPYPASATAPNQGWYWVEVFPFDTSVPPPSPQAYESLPSDDRPFVYRITAIALGQKTGTRAVVRSFFVPDTKAQNK